MSKSAIKKRNQRSKLSSEKKKLENEKNAKRMQNSRLNYSEDKKSEIRARNAAYMAQKRANEKVVSDKPQNSQEYSEIAWANESGLVCQNPEPCRKELPNLSTNSDTSLIMFVDNLVESTLEAIDQEQKSSTK